MQPTKRAADGGNSTPLAQAPADYEENIPYTVAVVALDEGPMVTTQLTDLGEQPVEMVTRKIPQDGDERGMLVYGLLCTPCGRKFRPVMKG